MKKYTKTWVTAAGGAPIQVEISKPAPEIPIHLILLREYIREHGPIKTVRVSSRVREGKAGYSAMRYEIRLRKSDGMPTNAPETGGSEYHFRRNIATAGADAMRLRHDENRMMFGTLGYITNKQARLVRVHIGDLTE